jgi:predicted tellurium resistance membrane protein TerC
MPLFWIVAAVALGIGGWLFAAFRLPKLVRGVSKLVSISLIGFGMTAFAYALTLYGFKRFLLQPWLPLGIIVGVMTLCIAFLVQVVMTGEMAKRDHGRRLKPPASKRGGLESLPGELLHSQN